jgi:ABC-type Zn uptake system ZnuABC Zn-binding protein ZnuA
MNHRGFPKRLALLAALAAVVPLVGCGGDDGAQWPDKPGPKVVASFPPIYSFALNVMGDRGTVKTAMTSQGPHHFDPKYSEAKLVRKADLFLVNGLGLDEEAAKKMQGLAGNRTLRLVNLGERFAEKELEEGGECEHTDADGHAHAHHHAVDPHVWLGIGYAKRQVEGIRDALKETDPGHAADYDRNAAEYVKKLQMLEAHGKEILKDKKNRRLVTFHGSLTYFAKTFDLTIENVIQVTPGKEPSAEALKKLVRSCKTNNVRVIAVEPQYSSSGSATRLLDELKRAGVEDPVLVEIDPLETAQESDLNAGWYEKRMRDNLEKLAGALK